MHATQSGKTADNRLEDQRRLLRKVGLVFAIFFPTVITWLYFHLGDTLSPGTKQAVFLTVKIVQFAFPAAWTLLALREPLRTARPTARGVLLGIVFGLVVLAAGAALFNFELRGLPVFDEAAKLIQQKVASFGIDSRMKYFLLATFYSVFHSLLEEYYWRWFVFRQLRRLMSLWPAAVLSAVAFTLHHIIVLSVFFAGAPWLAALLAGATAVGGLFWAWLFDRSGSVFDAWPSHLLIDVGVFFVVGYPLVKHMFT